MFSCKNNAAPLLVLPPPSPVAKYCNLPHASEHPINKKNISVSNKQEIPWENFGNLKKTIFKDVTKKPTPCLFCFPFIRWLAIVLAVLLLASVETRLFNSLLLDRLQTPGIIPDALESVLLSCFSVACEGQH